MMTVHKISGEDAVGYSGYLASMDRGVRRGDYHLSPGGWHGQAATELGLTGEVSREKLLGAPPQERLGRDRRAPRPTRHRAARCRWSRANNVSGGRMLAGTRPDDHDRMIWHTVPMVIALSGTYLADIHAGINYPRFS